MKKLMEELRQSGIYKITNSVNGKMYVGSAVHIWNRWTLHQRQLKKNIHHSIKLQRAWNLYGGENFSLSVIEFVLDREMLLDREQYWLDTLEAVDKGYNTNRNARNSLGTRLTEEHKARISAFFKGRKLSREHIEKRTASQTGIKRTPSTIEKLSRAMLGIKASAATKERLRLARLGISPTPESIAKGRETRIKNRQLLDPNYIPILTVEEKKERQRQAGRRSYEKRKEQLNAKARERRSEARKLREAEGCKKTGKPKRSPEAERLARIENQRRYFEKNRGAINARKRAGKTKNKNPAEAGSS